MSDLKTVEDVTTYATKLKEQNLSANPFVITNWKPYIRAEQGSLSLDFSLLNNWFYVDESVAARLFYRQDTSVLRCRGLIAGNRSVYSY